MDDSMALGYALGQDNGGNGGGSGMWGGDGSWIFAFLIIALIFGGNGFGGWGNGGSGGAGMQGALTRGDLCSEFSFNDLQNGVRGINDAVNLGFSGLNSTICHQQYDTAMLVNGLQTNMNAGFSGLNNAVCTLGYQNAQLINGIENTVQNGFNAMNLANLQNLNSITAGLTSLATQIANCCCETQRQIERSFCDLNYNIATQDCQTRQAIADSTREIIGFMTQDKMATLQAENQSLKLAASQAAQNTYLTNAICGQTAELINRIAPTPVPAYAVPAPYPYNYGGCGSWGYNGGCCGGL